MKHPPPPLWDEVYADWVAAVGKDGRGVASSVSSARRVLSGRRPARWRWVRSALRDGERKWFVASVFDGIPAPMVLVSEFVRAGVYEKNPSLNRQFLEPAVRAVGAVKVGARLAQYLEDGTPEEKAGAASAWYWCCGLGRLSPEPEAVGPLAVRLQRLLLMAFVSCPDLEVRRRTLPMLDLVSRPADDEQRQLVASAIAIAENHPDEYIRHRVRIQQGSPEPYKPLPETATPPLHRGTTR